MPWGAASCLGSLDLASALLLPSAVLVWAVGGIGLRSGLLTRETIVSRVVTVCLSVRFSRSSTDFMLFVRGLPDSVLLCAGRSSPDAGELPPGFCVREAFSWGFVRGIRADVLSAVEPLLLLLSPYLVEADIAVNQHLESRP